MNIIVIPTRGRSEYLMHNRRTFSCVKGSKHPIWMAVRAEEEDTYSICNNENYGLIICQECDNIAQKRHLVMEFCYGAGVSNVLFLDDDLEIYPRNESFSSKYAINGRVKHTIVDEMADQLFSICSPKFPMVGVCARQGSDKYKKAFYWKRKIYQAFALNVSTYFGEGMDFSKAPGGSCEDFDLQLAYRSKGYKIPSLASFVIGDGGRVKGGCQDYRDVEFHNNAIKELHKKYPEVTEIVKKKANTYWNHDRLDIKINFDKLAQGHPTKTEMFELMKKNGYSGEYIRKEVK